MTGRPPLDAPAAPRARRSADFYLALVTLYVLLLTGYVGLRYVWHGLDGDAISLTRLSRNVFVEGVLAPAAGAYPYGYAYPALNTFLAHLTGVPVDVLQVVVQPFLVLLLVPAAYAAYWGLTSGAGGRGGPVALLASLLLFLSPEFLFEATRSSHAKVTWLMALTMLFILARSFRSENSSRRLAVWVALFYLAAFALIASSSFFASSYVFGIAFAFAATHLLLRLPWTAGMIGPQMRRLSYVAASCLVLVFLFLFYLYKPGGASLYFLQTTLDKLAALFLDVETAVVTGVNPYAYVGATWLSARVYLALTTFNWFALLLSFAAWLRKGWMWFVRRQSIPPQGLLVWLLYASFASLMVFSLIADRVGALSANLQVRIFPHFLLVGVPLAAEGIVAGLGWARGSRVAAVRRLAPVLLVFLIAYFSLGSLLKITNEPLLSNQWTFYTARERSSVRWIGSHVRNNGVWVGRDIRLWTLASAYGDWTSQGITVDRMRPPVSSRYVLASDISAARAARIGEVQPDTSGALKVYDAGGTELYYSRPVTPYQR